jgi:hypothetical protein
MSSQSIQGLLTPYDSTVVLVDYQPQFAFTINSADEQTVIRNAISSRPAYASNWAPVPADGFLRTIRSDMQHGLAGSLKRFFKKQFPPFTLPLRGKEGWKRRHEQ